VITPPALTVTETVADPVKGDGKPGHARFNVIVVVPASSVNWAGIGGKQACATVLKPKNIQALQKNSSRFGLLR